MWPVLIAVHGSLPSHVIRGMMSSTDEGRLGRVVQTCKPSTGEAEAGELPPVQGLPELHIVRPSLITQDKKDTKSIVMSISSVSDQEINNLRLPNVFIGSAGLADYIYIYVIT